MVVKVKQMLVTPKGYKELQDELMYLKVEKREQVKNDIAVAKSFGDLSENAEYEEARNEQTKVESRIKELEEIINNVVIVDEAKANSNVVGLGSYVKVHDLDFDEDIEYSIVGSNEANAINGKISDHSPIGEALMGKKAGQTVTVETPNGVVRLKILELSRP